MVSTVPALSIGAVYTSLRTYDNQIIYLPNSQITTGSIVNMTSEDVRRVDVTVSALGMGTLLQKAPFRQGIVNVLHMIALL